MDKTREVLVLCLMCGWVRLVRLVCGEPDRIPCDRCRGPVEVLAVDGKTHK
jgi:hypothetical protein